MILSPHQLVDLLLYIPFLLGQLLYILKRSGFSMRAGRAPTRRAYVYQNWDILLFRAAFEIICVYMPMRHFTPAQILTFFHWNIGASYPFLQTPVESPIALFAGGIGSDGIIDWLVDWASRSPKVPETLKIWLTENLPKANGNGNH